MCVSELLKFYELGLALKYFFCLNGFSSSMYPTKKNSAKIMNGFFDRFLVNQTIFFYLRNDYFSSVILSPSFEAGN